MRKIREILRLKLECGLSNHEVARAAGCGKSTVFDYLTRFRDAGLSWPPGEETTDEALEGLLFGPTGSEPTRAIPDWVKVHEELRRKHVTLALLWDEYRAAHPDGYGYSRFCQIYRAWARRLSPWMRQTHRPGEKAFTDFAGRTIRIVDRATGETREAKVFVAVLGYSNFTYAEATWGEDAGSWIRANTNAVEYFGGAAGMTVSDNLKAAVRRAHRYDPDVNPTYADWARHYGTAIVPARARKPRDKAKVEVGVLVVERWILAALRDRTFGSLAEATAAMRPLLERLNDRVMKSIGRSRRQMWEEERSALRPLPARRYELAEWKKAKVNIDYHVEFDRHYYSVPHGLIHEEVEIRATAGEVEVLRGGKRIASHARSRARSGHTTAVEHMPKSHRAYQEWSPSRLIAWAGKVGPKTAAFVEEVMKRRMHPVQGFRTCLGVLRLGKRYGAERLEGACGRVAAARAYTYRSVESILAKGLDGREIRRKRTEALPPHENVRGSGYYN